MQVTARSKTAIVLAMMMLLAGLLLAFPLSASAAENMDEPENLGNAEVDFATLDETPDDSDAVQDDDPAVVESAEGVEVAKGDEGVEGDGLSDDSGFIGEADVDGVSAEASVDEGADESDEDADNGDDESSTIDVGEDAVSVDEGAEDTISVVSADGANDVENEAGSAARVMAKSVASSTTSAVGDSKSVTDSTAVDTKSASVESESAQGSASTESVKASSQVKKTTLVSSSKAATTTSAKKLAAQDTSNSVLVIAIDPGHGGYDSGAGGNGYAESSLTLAISKAMKAELEKYYGVKVILTRTDDYYVGLSERVSIAENAGAKVFISIHINSGGGTGFEVWAPTRSSNYNASQRDIAWAMSEKILSNLSSSYGLTNRGVKSKQSTSGDTYADGSTSDYFTVIDGSRRAGMVGILIEHGFIDNSNDASKLYGSSNLTRMGQLDAKAVADQYKLSTEERPKTTATVVGNGSVKLSWQKIKGATKYAIALRNADETYKTYTYDCTGTTYTVSKLTNGYKYTFLVQAYMKDHWTSYADYDHVTIAVTEAPKPTATPVVGSVKLAWSAISGASKYAIATKNADGSYKTYTYDCKATNYTVNGLAAGQKYQFLVQAYYPGGKIWSTFTDANLVAATPKGVSKPAPKASAASASSVKLTWQAVTNASKYAIARKDGSGYYTWTYDCKSTNYTAGGLNEGSTYQFLVQANVNGKWTAFTNADLVSFKVTDPTAPAVTAKATGDGTVKLTWKKISGASKYAIAEKMADGSYKTFTYDCKDGAYTVSNLSNGKAHRFVVQANVGGKWSSYKDMHLVSATPKGAVKPAAKASAASASQVKLAWNKVSGASAYAIARKSGSGYYTWTYDCKGTSYTAGGLDEGSTYQFLVQAKIDGKWSAFGNADLVSFKVTDPTAPAVTAKATGDGTVKLTWKKISGASKYAIAEKMADGSYKTFTYYCKDGAYTVSNLSNGKAHRFVVQANVGGKWSSYKDMHLVSATPKGAVKPTAKVGAVTANSIALSWNKVSGATKYAIASKNSNGSYKTYTYDCKKTSYTVSGLSAGTQYQLLVQALVDGKWSAFGNSDLVSGKTAYAPSNDYQIMGASSVTVAQMVKYYGTTGASFPASTYKSKGAASISDFAKIALQEANAEGVKAEVLFAQAMLETGNLKFGGDVQPSQCNFGGLGATGGGVKGASFASVQMGLRAQVQHLKAYASTAALNNSRVDPRFGLVTRGSATTVQQLSGKWATSTSYGNSIVTIINNIKKQ